MRVPWGVGWGGWHEEKPEKGRGRRKRVYVWWCVCVYGGWRVVCLLNHVCERIMAIWPPCTAVCVGGTRAVGCGLR